MEQTNKQQTKQPNRRGVGVENIRLRTPLYKECIFRHLYTRNALKYNFNQSYARTDLGKRALSFIGPKIWRTVPSDLKMCSFSTFKNNLKNNLLKTY